MASVSSWVTLLCQQDGGSTRMVSELQNPRFPKALAKPRSGGFRGSRVETAQTAVEIPTASLWAIQVFQELSEILSQMHLKCIII